MRNKSSSYIKIQLNNGNSCSILLDDYLLLSDIEFEELMSSDYGKYMEDVFADSQYNNTISFDEIDFEPDDE